MPPLDALPDVRAILLDSLAGVGENWQIKGVIDGSGRLYSLSNDTKLISKVFELVSFPIMTSAFERHGIKIEFENRQTVYPDATVILDGPIPNKIAIDIKSTYRRAGDRGSFTLGSYTAYMRSPFTKNIRYPYNEYASHWILGFIYSRVPNANPAVVSIDDIDSVVPPIADVEFIVREKWQIASDRPGSGNTANIGSVNRISALRDGDGTFARFGDDGVTVFEDYWRNYDRFAPRKYSNIQDYSDWRESLR